MASQAQIEANRKNAQRSTGPRTPAGKAKVALNALAHGLTAAKVVAGQEDGPLFEALRAQLQREWRPGSILEVMLVDRMAELIWQLRRVAGVEVQVLENMPKRRPPGVKAENFGLAEAMAKDFAKPNPTLMRVQMYQGRLERALHRTLAELRRLQIERQMQDEREEFDDEAEAIPVPLPGERSGEGMSSQLTWGAEQESTETANHASSTSNSAPSPLPASPQGEGPKGQPIPEREHDASTSPNPASPHLTSPGGRGTGSAAASDVGRSECDKTNPIPPANRGPATVSAVFPVPAPGRSDCPPAPVAVQPALWPNP